MRMPVIALCFSSMLLWGCVGSSLRAPTANQTDWQTISSNQLVWPLFIPRDRIGDLVKLTDVKVVFVALGSIAATAQLSIGEKYPLCPLLNREGQRPMFVLVLQTNTQAGLQVPLGVVAEGPDTQLNIVKDPVAIGPGIPTSGYLVFQGYCDR